MIKSLIFSLIIGGIVAYLASPLWYIGIFIGIGVFIGIYDNSDSDKSWRERIDNDIMNTQATPKERAIYNQLKRNCNK